MFVGDVGRPDLLERATKVANTMEASARTLFHSLKRIRDLPDFVQLWPGHGAGSACGKALGALPQSTIGYERVANWGLTTLDEDAFVREVLAAWSDAGGAVERVAQTSSSAIAACVTSGEVTVVDVRSASEWAAPARRSRRASCSVTACPTSSISAAATMSGVERRSRSCTTERPRRGGVV